MSKPVSLKLRPGVFYRVRQRQSSSEFEVALISSVFGNERDYWTVTRSGSDVHHMMDEFEFLAEVALPTTAEQLKAVK